MEKPTILIISTPFPQYEYLQSKYSLLYYAPNYEESPFVQAENILKDIAKKKIIIDGVFAVLDFHSEIAAIIAEKLHLPHTSIKSIYNAQNKAVFASLMEKAKLPYPETEVFDISKSPPTLSYPFFIRPIRGSFSAGAYIIRSDEDFHKAKEAISNNTSLVPKGFELFLLHYDPSLEPVRNKYLAQPYINTKQYIADGFVYNGTMHLFAITKAIYTKDRKSFIRYDFPAPFSQHLTDKLKKILTGLLQALQYDNAGFNVEFFLTPTNEIIIIELNTRITPGFLQLFEQQYELSPFEMMIQLSLGKKPPMHMSKKAQLASGFPLRLPYDCFVMYVPTAEEIEDIKKKCDILHLEVLVEKNTKLSEYRQDSYSFCYGRVDIAGKSLRDIQQKFHNFMKNNPIHLEKL